MAAILVGIESYAPRRVIDILAIVTSTTLVGMCASLLVQSTRTPLVYWFGSWHPLGEIALGVAFTIDPTGAGLATQSAFLTTLALIYSWRYFEAIGSLFHSLMLIFLAATIGFLLTGDLFNQFVFLELSSVAAYALIGYKIEESSSLQGTINFAIINSIGAFFVLDAISLLYGRTGALDLAQVSKALNNHAPDPLIIMAFVLLLVGYLIKAAIIPFHFADVDAHTVAPTPFLVLLSGIMPALGIYAIARIYWVVFSGVFAPYQGSIREIFLVLGSFTAILGGIMCFAQRNLKRLLAFSTISHTGIFLIGLGLFTQDAMAGLWIYILAHGLLKSGLFLCVGVLLHRYGNIDELELYRKGRRSPALGFVMAIGALGLAGLPPFSIIEGKMLIEHSAEVNGFSWVYASIFLASMIASGTILRAVGRIFLGWGKRYEQYSSEENEQEQPQKETKGGWQLTPLAMILPIVILIATAGLIGLFPILKGTAELAARQFQNPINYVSQVLSSTSNNVSKITNIPDPSGSSLQGYIGGLLSVGSAVVLALFSLFHDRLPIKLHPKVAHIIISPFGKLKALQSGKVSDYIAWLMFGTAIITCVFIFYMV